MALSVLTGPFFILRLQVGVFGAGGEPWAVFDDMGQLLVTDDAGLGVVASQLLQQCVERGLLLRGASVVVFTSCVHTALVADAQRAAVVASSMSATNALGQYRHQVAIAADVPVVAGLTELGDAYGHQVLDREVAVATRGRTVNYQ